MLSWMSHVKEEKNAINVIGAIARQTLRREIFQRIRMEAREHKVDSDAIRKCTRMFNDLRISNLKKAMLKWRENMK